jgi:hypothetical protein
MTARSFRNVRWNLECYDAAGAFWPAAMLGKLMDLQDELKKLNALLHCHNFTAIPKKLDAISENTRKPNGERNDLRYFP